MHPKRVRVRGRTLTQQVPYSRRSIHPPQPGFNTDTENEGRRWDTLHQRSALVEKSEGELMARHRLTKEEQAKGVQRALESPRTPPQLKKGLEKRQQQLEGSNDGSTES